MKKGTYQPDKKLVAVCGLFCPACGIFITQKKSLEERRKIAENLDVSVEALKCDGCRAENRFAYCETCKMSLYAGEKGLDYCVECEEYPCTTLKEFQAAMPHRIELWQDQARIKEVGYEKWFEEMLDHYSCTRCNTMNSAYHLVCRECGGTPSCAYVDLYKAEIMSYLSNIRESTSE